MNMIVKCGDWTLDFESRQIRRGADEVHVTPKAFEVLEVLVTSAPRALTKREIMDKVWSDVVVTENSLTAVIAELRAAFGDDPSHPAFIRTVQRYGYVFAGKMNSDAMPAKSRARVIFDNRPIVLSEGANEIGRDPESAVVVDHASVSRHHARIIVAGSSARLEDLDSKNGTFVRDQRVNGSMNLADGDEIRVGTQKMIFRLTNPTMSTATFET
jgi:DNA-binding winged helix-turn-helix (wHTH) protein